jgi:hypothetical protein
MPQNCQIIGVNSVTNIELDKGIMPAPIIRNADWSGKWPWSALLAASFARLRVSIISEGLLCEFNPCSYLYRIVANGRFTRAKCILRAI